MWIPYTYRVRGGICWLTGGSLLPLQSCKLFFSGSLSPGYGSIRNTILTSSRATSTRLTSARMRSRLLAQSAASKPSWSLAAKSSRRPIISCNSPCKAASSASAWRCSSSAGETLAQAGNPRLKLCLVDEALRITVDQPGHALAHLADLVFHCGQRRCVWHASRAANDADIPPRAAPGGPASYRLPATPPGPRGRSAPAYSDRGARPQSDRHPSPGSGNRHRRGAVPLRALGLRRFP